MRFNVPITITKAGAPGTLHFIKQYLGGETDGSVLGIMKPNGDIALLVWNDLAIYVSEDNSVLLIPDFDGGTFGFQDTSDSASSEFADNFEWLDISTILEFNDVGDYRQCNFFIKCLAGFPFTLVAYDWCMGTEDSEADILLNLWQEPVTLDPDTAFITTTQMQGREYLAISISGIVKPLCDINANHGCQVTSEGATFNVLSCNDVSAGGQGLTPVPQQVAICSDWDVTRCSVDGGNITTKLITTVRIMGCELGIRSIEKTDAPGTWHLLPSMFEVHEV